MTDTAAPLLDDEDDVRDEEELEDKILERAHADWKRASDFWRDNQDSYREDVRFGRLGIQWDAGLAKERAENGRPVLTINKLPPFIRQVVNDGRQNRPAIKVLPQDSKADPATAKVYTGLIRNIETTSDADVAYDTALDCSASGGFGFFRINLAYSDDESFEQDIVFQRIADPLTVLPDPDGKAADSSDWNIAFISEMVEKRDFKTKYPEADPLDFVGNDWPDGWRDGDKVRVVEYWRRDTVQKKRILLTNGQTVLEDDYEATVEKGDMSEFTDTLTGAVAEPAGPSRIVEVVEVTQYTLTGNQVIETVTWAGKWIPIVPVWGEEIVLEGEKTYHSVIHNAKDAQVLYNVNRTAAGEAVARAPLAPWLAEEGAVIDSEKWASANKKNWAYLEYKKGSNPPQRVGMPQSPVANLQEALTANDEMKGTIGVYDAGLGARSNETSGVAIGARKMESDTSTFHFIDNLSRAIRCAGRIIIDLIPKVYTPGRIIRILGEDGTPEIVRTGTPEEMQASQQAVQQAAIEQQETMQAVYALGTGRYDLTVAVGPAFNTRREESASQMMEAARVFPGLLEFAGDLVAKNLDWPGADELADRFKEWTAQRNQPQAQGQPQAEQPDPAKMAQVQLDAQKNSTDAALQQEKLRIDAFNAETQRMKAVHDIQQPTGLRTPAPVDFTGA